MPPRKKPDLKVITSGNADNYFTKPKDDIKFVSSGCTVLDCALGGGWALGRIANIVGDKSTAKTALAVEALTNFVRTYPDGRAAYRDAEAAFDEGYAQAMGLPIDRIDFGDPEKPITTVEDLARDLADFVRAGDLGEPGIYILDSLDALSDEAEMERKVGEASFGTAKAKLLSETFRKLARKLEHSNVLLIIVSQVRDNIGAMFGEKHKRSGGRALDFYASQIVWLARMKTLERTIRRMKRAYGVAIKANVKKNKIGLPHRTCEFDFIFGFGVEDLTASLAWLDGVGRLAESGVSIEDVDTMAPDVYKLAQKTVAEVVKTIWADVDTSFLPTRRKYD